MSQLSEMTQKLGDPDNFRNDIAVAAGLIANHFRQKYLEPMNKLYAEKRAGCINSPDPHITLLRACKPFISDQRAVDKMIDGISSCTAAAEIMRGISDISKKNNADNGQRINGAELAMFLFIMALMSER